MHSLTLRFLASHTTGLHVGTRINGGTVLHWVDEAGLACATSWAKGHCVTALISGARFAHPVHTGDLIEVQARLAYTGQTSMGIAVEVYRSSLPAGEPQQVLQCACVYVAVDDANQPRPIDTWNPETPGDMALAEQVRAHVVAARAV
ncbi:acyl-CoA thioesterase [Comamonas granuli]|uniref:acyl-CoA thioesterase n=1 Tax=Comamonas granuli TaxID=290309 RepID=UPI0005A70CBE|nr:hotdog domain-containing protein [Comamonas granuli]